MKEIVIGVSGGVADIEQNFNGVDVSIIDFDNGDVLDRVGNNNDAVIITVSGGIAEVYKEVEGVEVKIIDYDNLS